MWRFIYWSVLLLGSALLYRGLSGCQPPSTLQPIEMFYFPVADLAQGRVYEYVDSAGVAPPYYWYYIAVQDELGENYLIGSRYNHRFEPEQLTRERVSSDGTVMKDYRLYTNAGATQQRAEVLNGVLYPYRIATDTTLHYRFKVRMTDASDTTMRITVTKDRKWGGFTQAVVGGQTTPVVRLLVEDLTEIEGAKGGYWRVMGSGYELYAKGIGLIAERRTIGQQTRHYVLQRVMSMDELAAQADSLHSGGLPQLSLDR